LKELEKQKKEEIEPLKQKQVKKEKEILEKLSKNVIEAINNYNKDKRVEISFTGNGIKKILIYKTGSWISKGKYVEGLITGINAGDDKSVKIKIGEESFDLDFDEICIPQTGLVLVRSELDIIAESQLLSPGPEMDGTMLATAKKQLRTILLTCCADRVSRYYTSYCFWSNGQRTTI
jgi:hypothetical protein